MQRLVARVRALDPTRADALLAAVLWAAGVAQVLVNPHNQDVAIVLPAITVIAVLLAFRRRWPVPVAFGIAVTIAVAQPLGHVLDNMTGAVCPFLIAFYTAGSRVVDVRRTVLIWAGLSVILVSTAVTLPSNASPGDWSFIPLVAVGGPLLAGRLVGGQSRLSAALREKNAQLEIEREERARAAVADERARVARELHDVVAHSVSVMVVQAGAARSVMHTDRARAAAAFASVETVGRDALVEMRRLLGMLRPEDEPAQRAPQPGLARLEDLVGRARAAGLDVKLSVSGERPPLAAGLDLAAYRVLQEALTNALKHASGARVSVVVEYSPYELSASVVDDGRRGAASPVVDGSGHGITGMRERVALYGGALTAGPTATGGFSVNVRFPLVQEALA